MLLYLDVFCLRVVLLFFLLLFLNEASQPIQTTYSSFSCGRVYMTSVRVNAHEVRHVRMLT